MASTASNSLPPAPEGLSPAGAELWVDLGSLAPLDAGQLVTLTEICRIKGRLDKYDAILRGEQDAWMYLTLKNVATDADEVYELRIENAAARANADANLMKQLIASLRLPDEVTGKRPQQRNTGSGVQKPQNKGNVSSLERARAAKASGA